MKKTIKNNSKKQLNTEIDTDLFNKFKSMAAMQGLRVSEAATEALENWIMEKNI